MDYPKMPYLTEEILRTQRVEVYLQDLKDRLQQLRQKHNEVIENSVEIIKELDEVSSSLLSLDHATTITTPPTNSNCLQNNMTKINKIKKLINEFEAVKQSSSTSLPIAVENRVNIQQILQNFEHLNESHMLKESLVLFRRAKESFEKIDKFFGSLECLDDSTNNSKSINATATVNHINNDTNNNNKMNVNRIPMGLSHLGNSVRNKINLFSQTQLCGNKEAQIMDNDRNTDTKYMIESIKKANENITSLYESSKNSTSENYEDNNLNYVSCCSSSVSLNKYHSADNLIEEQDSVLSNSMENGYDGDNDDSEYNLFNSKRKKCVDSSSNANKFHF